MKDIFSIQICDKVEPNLTNKTHAHNQRNSTLDPLRDINM